MCRPVSLALFLAVCCLFSFAQRPGGGSRPVRPIEPGGNPITIPNSLGQAGPTANAEDESKVEFRSETILVQVPVVVTDKAGHHIHNLAKEDFQFLENGKEQTVSSMQEVSAQPTPVAVNKRPGVFSNLVLDSDKPRSLIVVALDTVNTPFLDQTYARRELIKYLSNSIDTGQTMALVLITSKGLKVVHGLTSSTSALQEELRKASGETPTMQTVDADVEVDAFTGDTSDLFNPITSTQTQAAINSFVTQGDIAYAQFRQEAAIETTMQAFLGIAWSLAGLPGRKTLLWATGSFPFSIDSPSAVPSGRLSLLYERAMEALNEAQVSVYPVDVRGLLTYAPDVSSNRVRAGAAALQQTTSRAWLAASKQDTLKDFAEMTGGKAYYNTNDLAGAFQRASDDGASYYLLGYYLDTKNTKPGWRQLKVKVKGKDLEIRARKGFFVTNATMNPEITRVNDMNFAIAAPFEATGIPFEMQWGPVKESPGSAKKQVAFSLHVLGGDITIDGLHNAIDLAVVAVATKPISKKETSDAVIAGNFSQSIKGSLTPEKATVLKAHGVALSNVLALDPGRYNVRFVVRDNFSGRIGSVSAPITVN